MGRETCEAFARIATNVAVVTAPGPQGCTANVWAEAPDPPVVLVTLRRGGATHGQVTSAGRFGVNLLAEDQAALARRFAGPRQQRFEGLEYEQARSGVPLLTEALAALDCEVRAVHWFGAYDVVVGDVAAATLGPARRPLVFAAGKLLSAAPLEVAS